MVYRTRHKFLIIGMSEDGPPPDGGPELGPVRSLGHRQLRSAKLAKPDEATTT